MEAQDQPGIRRVFINTDAHSSGLSALFLGLSGRYHPGSQCAAGRVQSAGCHGNAFLQAHLCCRCPRQFSDNPVAGHDLRQQFPRDSQLFAHPVVPAAFPHIKAGQSVSLGKILGDLAGHPVDDIAVRLQDLFRFFKHLRPVLPVPEDLRPGITRFGRISAQAEQSFLRQRFCCFPADIPAPGIRPDRCRAKYGSRPVQGNGGPALSVRADPGNFRRINAVFGDHFPHCPADPVPPEVRILFRPSLPGIADRILASSLGRNLSFRIKQGRLAGRGPDIHTQQQGSHLRTLLLPLFLFRPFRCFPAGGSAPVHGSAQPCGLPPGTSSGQRHPAVLP